MKAKEYTIYKHTCPDGKVYIGKTKRNPASRWRGGKGYIQNERFWAAINMYGWDNICHEILYTGLTEQEANEKEIELIELYQARDCQHGYNTYVGGALSSYGIHRTLSEETKQKMRESSYWKNHKITDEMKQKMSAAKKGKPAKNRKRIVCIESGEVFLSITEASKHFNVCPSAISNCLSGLAKRAAGVSWKYE